MEVDVKTYAANAPAPAAAPAAAAPAAPVTAAEAPKAVPAADDAEYTDVKFSGVRKATAKGMMKSLSTMAQLTHYHSFDASALLALRKQIKANGEAMGMPEHYLE